MERLVQEFNSLIQAPEPHITVSLKNNSYFCWEGTLYGPEGSPYEGGKFKFEITFQSSYPTTSPRFVFKTPIFHPNVYSSSGNVCCEIFGSGWRPTVTVRNIFAYVAILLSEPAPQSGYGGDATNLCKNNRQEFNRRAREETMQHAK